MEMEGEMELIELLARMMDRSRVAVHVSAKQEGTDGGARSR